MDSLDAKLRQFRTDGLTEEDQRAVEAFQKAMERRNAGKLDDDPFARD